MFLKLVRRKRFLIDNRLILAFDWLGFYEHFRARSAETSISTWGDRTVSYLGKTHLVIMFTVGPEDVAEGDRIFASHGDWMKGHPRDGDSALLEYTVSKGPELANPLDPNSEPTGRTIFVLDEFYESSAGIANHWQDAIANWSDLSAIMAWAAKGTVVTLHDGKATQALW